MLKPGKVSLLWTKFLNLFFQFIFNDWWRSCWNLSDSWTCISAAPVEEALATNVEARTEVVCEDTSAECDDYAKYCGKNSYVNERCKKTCGQSPCKSPYLQCYLLNSFRNINDNYLKIFQLFDTCKNNITRSMWRQIR